MIMMVESTTAVVVARRSPWAPPRVDRPTVQLMQAMR
jgi:hypothetical protein